MIASAIIKVSILGVNLGSIAGLNLTGFSRNNLESAGADDSTGDDDRWSTFLNGTIKRPKRTKVAKSDNDDDDDDDDYAPPLPPGQCGLFLAPSTLPHAGLGLFSGSYIPFSHSVNEYISGTFHGYNDDTDPPIWTDLYIPIADDYKALPYRGQQRFPSWLQYIWPKEHGALTDLDVESFPTVPVELWDFDLGLNLADSIKLYTVSEQGKHNERVNAFVPGLATLANSHNHLYNMRRIDENSKTDFNGQVAPWQPGVGAFTPHHGIEFYVANKTGGVYAGMELLLNYGSMWNKMNKRKLDFIACKKKDDEMFYNNREKKGFVEGIHKKWDMLNERELDHVPDELPTEKAKRERLEKGMAADSSMFKEGEKPYSEYRPNDYHPSKKNDDDVKKKDKDKVCHSEPRTSKEIMKPLPWLNKNGVCLSSGKLRVKPSKIPFAGRGVFATTQLGKDEVLLTSPLIVMRREDFTIYKTNNTAFFLRHQIDKTSVVAVELLFNYAFSHPESPLFLIPNAPLANFINHGVGVDEDNPVKSANVQVRWPKGGTNSAKLFEWAYKQQHANHFDNNFESTTFNDPNPWLKDHPIDVLERSGKLALEFVALRDIRKGEEILIDYGQLWQDAWTEFSERSAYARSGYFRHSIAVPDGLFPDNWLNVSDRYEIAEIQDLVNKPLAPGVAMPMTWAHNGKPVSSKYAYIVGLEKGFSERFLEYSEKKGVIELYRKLLTEEEGYQLPSDGFGVYRPSTLVNDTTEIDKAMEFFAHRYKSSSWNFNMHFVAAWDEYARKDILSALSDAGFDLAVDAIGKRFGYDNMTCFHSSYMGVTHCDKSKMHSDIYATGDKSWNIIFPLITVEGSDPELDIMAEDMNTVIGVNYLNDVAFAVGDYGFHQTRPINYYNPDDREKFGNLAVNGVPIRVVFGIYCAQIDEENIAMIRHVYDGDDPAPFADQFTCLPMKEFHWQKENNGGCTLSKPGKL